MNSTTGSSSDDGHRLPNNVRRRRSRHVHAAGPDDCIFERVFWTPMATPNDEHRIDNPFRVVVKRSPNFGLSEDFHVYHSLSDATNSSYNDTADRLTQGSDKTDSVRHGCFYTGHVSGMTSSRAAVSVIGNYIVSVSFVSKISIRINF
jgi:hypothetical protein